MLNYVAICFILYRGSLISRNLAEIVKKEHFVLDSEYLVTLVVVVPK
jgi:V-type H+-transporting ATPase subunit C